MSSSGMRSTSFEAGTHCLESLITNQAILAGQPAQGTLNSISLELGLQTHATGHGFLCGYWGLNSGPCACKVNALPMEPFPRHSFFLTFITVLYTVFPYYLGKTIIGQKRKENQALNIERRKEEGEHRHTVAIRVHEQGHCASCSALISR